MLTPLMRQYYDIKNNYPDTLLLFQVGDFYELFFDDAKTAASVLGIVLTQRGTTQEGDPIPLCGVPIHVLDTYLAKLVKAGFKVAICEQLEAPRPGKMIDRGVTQVLTPGTLTDSKLLHDKSASYLAVLFPTQSLWGLLFVEVLTGQLFITTIDSNLYKLLEAELSRFLPDELVLPETKLGKQAISKLQQLGYCVASEQFNPHAQDMFTHTECWFNNQFSVAGEQFSEKADAVKYALILLYSYLKRNNERGLQQLKQISVYQPTDFLLLDAATQRNLELVKNAHDGTTNGTLFSVLDNAVTPMGSRTIKKWILRPLIKQELIEQRLDAIAYLISDMVLRQMLRKLLRAVGDSERIIGRIALRRTQLYDYISLLRALEVIPAIAEAFIGKTPILLLENIISKLSDFGELYNLLSGAINDDSTRDWLIKAGFNQELDRLRALLEHGAQAIIQLERREQEATGINSLKIKYNGIHGYGIEITKTHSNSVPDRYTRIQTLAHRERFTTQELKDLEYDLNRARTDTVEVEKEIFEKIKQQVELYLIPLKKLSHALAYLDALISFAQVAYINNYSRPLFTQKQEFIISDGRHPVVEAKIKDRFISNSTIFNEQQLLVIITGPNMGGKSTYLRQVALIALMAQIGSFVPAKQAQLNLVDKIFTRIGASDNMSEGKSTFLIEMEETALICTQATKQSLVILDEVGRGTSTRDGLAIAQAVVEYLYTHVQARCLFATHYHELTILSEKFPGISSYYAASTKTPEGIVLLHKIIPGIADGSFGLEVAKLAHMPVLLLDRAQIIMQELIAREQKLEALTPVVTNKQLDEQLVVPQDAQQLKQAYQILAQRKSELELYREQQEKMLNREKVLIREIANVDYDNLTPKQAFDILWRLKECEQ